MITCSFTTVGQLKENENCVNNTFVCTQLIMIYNGVYLIGTDIKRMWI